MHSYFFIFLLGLHFSIFGASSSKKNLFGDKGETSGGFYLLRKQKKDHECVEKTAKNNNCSTFKKNKIAPDRCAKLYKDLCGQHYNNFIYYARKNDDKEFLNYILLRGSEQLTDESPEYFAVACKEGKQDIAKQIIESGLDINRSYQLTISGKYLSNNKEDDTPLGIACKYQQEDVVNELLKRKAPVNVNSPAAGSIYSTNNVTLLMNVSRKWFMLDKSKKKQARIIAALIESGADVHAKDGNGETVLHHVMDSCNPGALAIILHAASNLNKSSKFGITPLMTLCMRRTIQNKLKMLDMLIAAGGAKKVNAPSRCGDTALHFAAENGSEGVCRSLLDADAKPDVQNKYGDTPLMKAAYRGSLETVKLFGSRAKLDVENNEGETALLQALEPSKCPYNSLLPCKNETVKCLLELGAKVNIQTKNGMTPLLKALLLRDSKCIVEALLKYGADVNKKDRYGRPMLFYASSIEMLNLLLEQKNLKINHRNKDGDTLLGRVLDPENMKNLPGFYNETTKELLLSYGAEV